MADPKVAVQDDEVDDIDLSQLAGDDDVADAGGDKGNDDSVQNPEGGNEPELSEIEQVAYAQGWRPKEEFVKNGGDPKAWKEAGWWLDRGELLGQQSQLRKEVKEIKKAFIQMTEYNRQAYIKGQQDAIKSLKDQKRQAMKDGNLEVVADIDDQIDQAQEVLEVAKETQVNVLPETKEETRIAESQMYQNWLESNKWYTSDERMHHYANSAMVMFKQKNPTATPAEALAAISRDVKEAFPQKFAESRRVSQPSVGGRGTNSTGVNSNGGNSIQAKFQKIVGQMDSDTKRAVLDMVRSGDISMKEYVEGYQE